DRALSHDESERLEEMLVASRDARSVYIAYMQLDAGLDWKVRGSQSLDGMLLEHSQQLTTALRAPVQAPGATQPRLTRRRLISLLALAASILLVMASLAWWSSHSARNAQDVAAADSSKNTNVAAEPVVAANVVKLSKESQWFVENRRGNDSAIRTGD